MEWLAVKKFPLDADLSLLVSFLQSRGVQFRIYEKSNEQILEVFDENVLPVLQKLIDDLEQGRVKIEVSESPIATQQGSKLSSFWNLIQQTPVTCSFIVLSFLGALLVAFDENFSVAHWLLFQEFFKDPFSVTRQALVFSQPWRLITPIFLHFGAAHVIFNSLGMWVMGCQLEAKLKALPTFIFFMLVAAFSNSLQYWWLPNELFGGMSGVVCGLAGFILVMSKLNAGIFPDMVKTFAFLTLVSVVISLSDALKFLMDVSVANTAHLAGIFAGALVAYLAHHFNWIRPSVK